MNAALAPLAHRAKQVVRATFPRPAVMWLEREYYRRTGEAELPLVDALCDPRRDALDIGSNEGCYLHFMRGNARHVHAFEPVPWLAANLAMKFGTEVTVHPVALSAEAGEAELHVPLVDGRLETGLSTLADPRSLDGYEQKTITVQLRRLDDAYVGQAGLIKIDVEGHEEAVLAGAHATIIRCRPNLVVEIEERHAPGAIGRITGMLKSLGYDGFFLDHGQLAGIERFDAATMQREQDIAGFVAGTTRRSFPDYINNFMFVPSEQAPAIRAKLVARLGH